MPPVLGEDTGSERLAWARATRVDRPSPQTVMRETRGGVWSPGNSQSRRCTGHASSRAVEAGGQGHLSTYLVAQDEPVLVRFGDRGPRQ